MEHCVVDHNPASRLDYRKFASFQVNILSVFKNKLLVSSGHRAQLFIYSCDGHHISTIKVDKNDELRDATWTPRGNIVYTTCNSKKVVVMSKNGKIITTHCQMKNPRYLSVSNDGTIYLADWKRGVYQSTDDGNCWSLILKSIDGWHFERVVKVVADSSDDFWAIGQHTNCYLRVYSVDRRRSNGNVTWRDLNLTTTDGKYINCSLDSSLSFDGNTNIFLSDCHNNVHVFSVDGQYQCQLLSSHDMMNTPRKLAVDRKHQLLFVGQTGRVVEVFRLS